MTLEFKVANLALADCKKSVVMSGFYTGGSRSKKIADLQEFFEDEMGIEVKVMDVFPIGKAIPRQLVITLETLDQKSLIFQNINMLQGVTNADGN